MTGAQSGYDWAFCLPSFYFVDDPVMQDYAPDKGVCQGGVRAVLVTVWRGLGAYQQGRMFEKPL